MATPKAPDVRKIGSGPLNPCFIDSRPAIRERSGPVPVVPHCHILAQLVQS